MEEGKKRSSKRQREVLIEDDSCSGDDDGRKKAAMETVPDVAESHRAVEAVPQPQPSPSDEEVDEFFAILRRMHAAIGYFNRRGVQIDNRSAMEAEPSAAVAVAKVEEEEAKEEIDNIEGGTGDEEKKSKRAVEEDLLLDLNSSPKDVHRHDHDGV